MSVSALRRLYLSLITLTQARVFDNKKSDTGTPKFYRHLTGNKLFPYDFAENAPYSAAVDREPPLSRQGGGAAKATR